MSHNVYVRVIDEQIVDGMRLGRNVEHDERSLGYTVSAGTVTTVSWSRHIPILDQGDVGSCTGNAAAGCLGTEPFSTTVSSSIDEREAVKLYSEATRLDSISGSYPPTDTGSTGLAVAKACKNDGLISGYQHATTIDAALTALSTGPVITGVNWYAGFDQPTSNGFVAISGRVRGGHEFVVRGIDTNRELVYADNSWGTSWGKDGSFSFSFADWERLLNEEGDVTVFTPNTAPAPTPTPPGPSTADAALQAAGKRFWRAWKAWETTL